LSGKFSGKCRKLSSKTVFTASIRRRTIFTIFGSSIFFYVLVGAVNRLK
jgi:hypothetical protein